MNDTPNNEERTMFLMDPGRSFKRNERVRLSGIGMWYHDKCGKVVAKAGESVLGENMYRVKFPKDPETYVFLASSLTACTG
jgi:hypothetical protein